LSVVFILIQKIERTKEDDKRKESLPNKLCYGANELGRLMLRID